MPDIVMPRLSDSMEEGTILVWMKQVGDEVAVGDEIVEIETDKANMAYESDVAGTLTEILADEGETLAIGSPIARVGDSAEGSDAATAAGATGQADSDGADDSESKDGADRIKASPVARRIAKEKGMDLATIEGSGPGGRIVKKDVKQAATSTGDAGGGDPRPAGPVAATPGPSSISPETAKGQVTFEDLSKLQSTIARRMSESKATAPHFYLEAEIDMSRAVEARARIKATAGDGEGVPSFNDMIVKACALALREHPRANGAYRDGRFELYSRVNVGVAVAAQDALVVPTVYDADKKSLGEIARDTRALAERVRANAVTPPELSGGTFTVSNLGMFGVTEFSAVINPPQAAILAVGKMEPRAVVRDGEIVARNIMTLTLVCDHRILYGADAAEFLARIKALLEHPIALAL